MSDSKSIIPVTSNLPKTLKHLDTHNTASIDVNGTCLQGYIDISYAELVAALGEHCEGDAYKVDAEWMITDGERVATIYNYKSGPNYCGGSRIFWECNERDWHIGGRNTGAVDMVRELFPDHSVKTGW